MAGIKDSTIKSKPKPRRTYFLLGCFGFSKKKMSDDLVKSSASRKKNRFLSWSRFHRKKLAVKTVPMDTNSPEKLGRITEIVEILADQTVNNKPHKKGYKNSDNIILESGENLDSAKNNTCQKVIPRKKDSKGKSISHQGSPESRKNSVDTNNVLSHSASFPAIQVAATTTGDSHINKYKSHQGSGATAGNFDPVVGMSIIMVTLIIMVVWGKLCAILCTSAWFYFVPRLRKSVELNTTVGVNNGGLKLGETDINSEEYKKKVVLEGLLRRSHRNVAGVL